MSRVYQNRAAAPRATANTRSTPTARSPQRPQPAAPSTRGGGGGGGCGRGARGARGCTRPPRAPVTRNLHEEFDRPTQTERTVQVGDGFQMFTPSNEKREQMQRQAEDERRRYEAHVERTRLRGIHEVHRLGGDNLTEDEVRQRQAENYRREKFARLEKSHQNQMQKKFEEEKEIEERKQAARHQALKNSQRATTETTGWTDESREQDRIETMDRFLNRLSQRTNEMTLESDENERKNDESKNDENQLKILRELFPYLDDETLRSRLEIYEGNIELIVQDLTE